VDDVIGEWQRMKNSGAQGSQAQVHGAISRDQQAAVAAAADKIAKQQKQQSRRRSSSLQEQKHHHPDQQQQQQAPARPPGSIVEVEVRLVTAPAAQDSVDQAPTERAVGFVEVRRDENLLSLRARLNVELDRLPQQYYFMFNDKPVRVLMERSWHVDAIVQQGVLKITTDHHFRTGRLTPKTQSLHNMLNGQGLI